MGPAHLDQVQKISEPALEPEVWCRFKLNRRGDTAPARFWIHVPEAWKSDKVSLTWETKV